MGIRTPINERWVQHTRSIEKLFNWPTAAFSREIKQFTGHDQRRLTGLRVKIAEWQENKEHKEETPTKRGHDRILPLLRGKSNITTDADMITVETSPLHLQPSSWRKRLFTSPKSYNPAKREELTVWLSH